ncbi:LPS export ABC transporter permease LptF [Dichotomicrobium thermohalophilum]|uniref:Lipopolysaccharide export system permease protein n=1 Tax=Dichotomicrobium thermohalophilum TaxID=933063 RepID=A0A397Q5A2_9HYPH|nr:LPS export ABC transporter permease LptF [Dichotomicrobium thermohalophilum]RIA56486.1 lipopolysaccharide export system permease protein [Dichotomicrobium thermohalophilum]
MDTISRHIFKQTVTATLMILATLTLIVWMTTALRRIDVMTEQGQGFLIFVQITLLALPRLVTAVAPVALLIATIHVLNRLHNDSGIVILTAAGATTWRLMRPFLLLAGLVSVFVLISNAYLTPYGLRMLRDYITEVRTDLISQVIQPGNFVTPEDGLTFHIRDREADGTLRGLMVNDSREEQQTLTYLADRGRVIEQDGQPYIIMREGHIHRVDGDRDEVQVIAFDSYIFDISEMGPERGMRSYEPKERILPALWTKQGPHDWRIEKQPGDFRAELHDRLSNPLYSIAFVLVAVAMLGYARTTREGANHTVALVFVTCVGARGLGLAMTNMADEEVWAVPMLYAIPIGTVIGALVLAQRNMRPHQVRRFDIRLPSMLRALPLRLRAGRTVTER